MRIAGWQRRVAAAASLSTHQKALAVNLDSRTYGALAEIGGGQEVARWFFFEWHRAVAPGGEVREITTNGLALSRLKHGF
jgi:hypothetical protein